MTQMQVLVVWAHVAAGAAFWTCLLWPALVRAFWPWHRSEWGWNMVVKVELIALALLAGVLHTEFGVPLGWPVLWTEVIAVTLIPLAVIWRTLIIWRAQRDGARDERLR